MKNVSLYILFLLLLGVNALWVYAVGGLLGWILPAISSIAALIAMIYRDNAASDEEQTTGSDGNRAK